MDKQSSESEKKTWLAKEYRPRWVGNGGSGIYRYQNEIKKNR